MLGWSRLTLRSKGRHLLHLLGRVPLARQPVATAYGMSRIGNREVVGFGMNGQYTYYDRHDFPFPAVRFKECTPEIMAMREKERGDWRKLSILEKKCLYRASFCETFSEMSAPTGEYKGVIGNALLMIAIGIWVYMYVHLFAYGEEGPVTFERERRIQQYYRQVGINNQPFSGNYIPRGAEKRVAVTKRPEETIPED